MPTTSQAASRAGVALNTVRNYVRDFPDLFSEGARGLQGNRRFSEDDVEVICTLVALKNSGMALADAVDRLRTQEAPTIVDVPSTTLQEPATSLQPRLPDYALLQQSFNALQQRHEAHLRRQLWTHFVAFYMGFVTMGVLFLLVWWLVNR